MNPHLLVAISSHGYGHLAQVSPAINALQDLSCATDTAPFELTVRSALPHEQIARRIHRPFDLDIGSDDFGMVMHDALRVDLVESLQRYDRLHQQWDSEVNRLASHLQALNVSGVLADAPYLTLAAAQMAAIPAVAICSLNWADILERCVAQDPNALEQAGMSNTRLHNILAQIQQAYVSAATILRPEPAIQTSRFETMSIDPLVQPPPSSDRDSLLAAIGAQVRSDITTDDPWIVLTSMGGIELPLDPRRWPTSCLGRPVIYIIAGQPTPECPHVVSVDIEQYGFSNLLASCDAALTKPGYGMFVEARACGKPMLYLARDTWPESQCLEQWAATHTHATKLSSDQVARGDFGPQLAKLLSLPALGRQSFKGADQAAREIKKQLWR